MTLQFNDSWNWVNTSSDSTIRTQLAYDGWILTDAGGVGACSGGTDLYGGKYVQNATGNHAFYMRHAVPAAQTYIAGALVTPTGLNAPLITFYDGATIQGGIFLSSSGELYAFRSSSLTQIGSATAAGIMAAGSTYFIEVKWKADPSAGTVEVRLNGSTTPVLNLSSQNTRDSGTSQINNIGMWRSSFQSPVQFSQWYFADTSGSVNNDFLGHVRSEPVLLTSDVLLASTPSTGSTAYNLLDETPLSATADYTTFTAAGADLYGVADLASTPAAVYGVRVLAFALKSDAGTCTARVNVKNGSTTANGATVAVPVTIESSISGIFETNPDGDTAWTGSTVNSMQIGVERVS